MHSTQAAWTACAADGWHERCEQHGWHKRLLTQHTQGWPHGTRRNGQHAPEQMGCAVCAGAQRGMCCSFRSFRFGTSESARMSERMCLRRQSCFVCTRVREWSGCITTTALLSNSVHPALALSRNQGAGCYRLLALFYAQAAGWRGTCARTARPAPCTVAPSSDPSAPATLDQGLHKKELHRRNMRQG